MSLNAEERASIIAKAMDRSFGELLVWKRPVLAHSFGENDLGQVDIFEEALEKIRADVVFAFEQMSNDDLSQMDLELSDNFRISEHNPAALSVKKIERLRRLVPQPIAYGFGHPAFAAKFEHWARKPRLRLCEVALLSLGADLGCVRDDKFADLKKTRDSGKPLWADHASFLERREIFKSVLSLYWLRLCC